MKSYLSSAQIGVYLAAIRCTLGYKSWKDKQCPIFFSARRAAGLTGLSHTYCLKIIDELCSLRLFIRINETGKKTKIAVNMHPETWKVKRRGCKQIGLQRDDEKMETNRFTNCDQAQDPTGEVYSKTETHGFPGVSTNGFPDVYKSLNKNENRNDFRGDTTPPSDALLCGASAAGVYSEETTRIAFETLVRIENDRVLCKEMSIDSRIRQACSEAGLFLTPGKMKKKNKVEAA